jgi:hypothetical protein
MSFANGFLIRSGHKAERLALLQIYVRRMTVSVKLLGSLFERVELLKELFFREYLHREATLSFVVSVNKILHCVFSYSLKVRYEEIFVLRILLPVQWQGYAGKATSRLRVSGSIPSKLKTGTQHPCHGFEPLVGSGGLREPSSLPVLVFLLMSSSAFY